MKLFSWLSKLLFTTLFVSVLSITITIFMVNMYAQEMIKSVGIQIDDSKFTFSNVLSQLSGQGNTMNEGELELELQEDNVSESPSSDEVKNDAVEVWKQQSTTNVQEREEIEEKSNIVITIEEFNKTKDLLSDEDKMSLFSMVISKVPADEVQKLSLLMEDGITQEEMNEIEEIIGLYLNEEEYENLLSILNRYE